jgi:hypothetical protein
MKWLLTLIMVHSHLVLGTLVLGPPQHHASHLGLTPSYLLTTNILC